jgi:hypothetical protein
MPVSDPARDENPQDELSFGDLKRFEEFLDLGQFDASNTSVQTGACRAWLVFQHATARRWMRDFRTLWPPMHEQLDKLRQDLTLQNKQIDALCAGPYSFLAVAKMKTPGEEPRLFARYCKDIVELFNTLSLYASFAKIYDHAYAEVDFSKVDYDSNDLGKYRIELSQRLESLAITLELMAESLLPEAQDK